MWNGGGGMTICLVPYKNEKNFYRVLADVEKTIDYDRHKIMVVDNNSIPLNVPGVLYYHHKNRFRLAGATNFAIQHTEDDVFCYLCSNHVRIYADDWADAIEDYIRDHDYAMAGDLQPFSGRKHVQGGVWAGKTAILKRVPYKQYDFSFMDVWITDELIKRGYKVGRIPFVKSVMAAMSEAERMRSKRKYKIIHSH